jgi:hypothetical protein
MASYRRVERLVLEVRGQRVIVDHDLAALYGVSTRRLNEQVSRNRRRFPKDFMFRLARSEKAEVVANCDHLRALRFSATLPNVFTEHGAIMAANVLKSERAIEMSVLVVRTFVKLRARAMAHGELPRRIDELEAKYDAQFKVVFDAIRALMDPTPAREKRRIGFRVQMLTASSGTVS